MPAPVPPGFTRGPLVFMTESPDPIVEQGQHQWLWREAGGYGARLVLITTEAKNQPFLEKLRAELASWECDRLTSVVAQERATGHERSHAESVEQATGIILIGEEPLRTAAILGGTPLAQAIRRANARSKLVAGIGTVAAFLCQHIISPTSQAQSVSQAQTLRQMVAFGPGLGLVNRLVVDANSVGITGEASAFNQGSEPHLVAAVAANPFLFGVGLPAGSAAILYPDNTLQANGPNPVTIMDGLAIEAAELDAAWNNSISIHEAVVGALHYTLHAGDGFNLDNHTYRPANGVDLPLDLPPTGPVTSAF